MSNYAAVQEHLELLNAETTELAAEAVRKFIRNLNLENLSNEEKVLTIHNELLRLKEEIAAFKCPEYIHLANYEDAVAKLFYSRLTLFGKNESELVKSSIILNSKHRELQKQFRDAKNKFSDFTFSDFLSGKPNVIFYHLKQRPGKTTEEDYLQMRTWQNNKLLELIRHETFHFISIFRNHYIESKSPNELLANEIQNIKQLFKENYPLWIKLYEDLTHITALKNSVFPDNSTEFLYSFNKFLNHKIDLVELTPQNLQFAIDNYLSDSIEKPLSFCPVVIYSLLLYEEWLRKVKEEELTVNKNISLDYDSLFEEAYVNAFSQSEKILENLWGCTLISIILPRNTNTSFFLNWINYVQHWVN